MIESMYLTRELRVCNCTVGGKTIIILLQTRGYYSHIRHSLNTSFNNIQSTHDHPFVCKYSYDCLTIISQIGTF